MKSKILIILSFFGGMLIILKSCSPKPSTSNYSVLVSEKEIDEFVLNWMKTNHKSFDWIHAPDNILYSALMHSDSTLSINYFIDAAKDRGKFYSQSREMPIEWIEEGDKIIEYVLEKEKLFRKNTSITKRDLLIPSRGRELAVIKIKISDPSIITGLRKNYYVHLGTYYIPPSLR